MIINKTTINKFSFGEAMSNSNGKTSGSKFAGFIALCSGSIGFLVAVVTAIFKSPDALALAGISGGIITTALAIFGYSKKKATKDSTNLEVEASE
jgi:hypothetical protein